MRRCGEGTGWGMRVAVIACTLVGAFDCNGDEVRRCDLDHPCPEAEVCIWTVSRCVPRPASDGGCPPGYAYADCATGSCPMCRDCVAACLPPDLR